MSKTLQSQEKCSWWGKFSVCEDVMSLKYIVFANADFELISESHGISFFQLQLVCYSRNIEPPKTFRTFLCFRFFLF